MPKNVKSIRSVETALNLVFFPTQNAKEKLKHNLKPGIIITVELKLTTIEKVAWIYTKHPSFAWLTISKLSIRRPTNVGIEKENGNFT